MSPFHAAPRCEEASKRLYKECAPTRPTSSAASRVFAIYELAETIFLELPPCDILINQRVCKYWRDITVGSTPLQQALFFKPIDSRRYTFHGDQSARSEHDQYQRSLFQHPMVEYLAEQMDRKKNRRGAWRPEVSWRRMLIVQPAISSLRRGPRGDSTYQIQNQDGVRLGDMGARSRKRCSKRHDTNVGRKKGIKRSPQTLHSPDDLKQFWRRTDWLSGWQSWERIPWDEVSAKEILALIKDNATGGLVVA